MTSQHRKIAVEKIGRLLRTDEDVHHKDRNKKNNDPDNLKVLTKKEHQAEHALEKGARLAAWNRENQSQRMMGNKHCLGKKMPDSHRQSVSKRFKGKPKSPEQRLKISMALKGRKFSAKHCDAISHAARMRGPEFRDKVRRAAENQQRCPATGRYLKTT